MENNSLLSFGPTPILSHFLSSLSSMSPLLPLVWRWLVEDAGWGAECKRGGVAVYLLGSLRSTPFVGRIWMWQSELCWECEAPLCQGPNWRSPQLYLRKWQSGGLPTDCSVSPCVSRSAQSTSSFLLQEWQLFSFVGGCYFHTCWERGQHTHTKQCVGGMFCVIVSATYPLNCSPPNIWPFRAF